METVPTPETPQQELARLEIQAHDVAGVRGSAKFEAEKAALFTRIAELKAILGINDRLEGQK